MRVLRAVVGVVLVAALALACLAVLKPRQQLADHPYFDAPGPWVVAHRGGAAIAPENTLEAFQRARDLGVDVLEMDLRVTADGSFAVIHDASVDRTTDGRGRVGEMTLSEIKTLDAGARFADETGATPFAGRGIEVPSFPEVLRRFPRIRLNVEMKDFTPDQARSLCGLLREHGSAERVLVSSFGHEPMTALREACPEIPTGATTGEAITFDVLHRLRLGRLFRSPARTLQLPLVYRGRRVLTREMVDRARAFDRPVQAWTVNDEAEMRRCLDIGVQAILTDRPDLLLALLDRRPPKPVNGALSERPGSGL